MSEPATYLGKDAAGWERKLSNRDPVLRRLAVYALGEIGTAAKEVGPALDAGLRDRVDWVRVWSAAALARVTGEPRAVDLLIAESHAPEAFVRSLVAWHLGRLGADFPGIKAGIDAVEQLLGDADPSVRAEATLALQTLRRKGALPSGAALF